LSRPVDNPNITFFILPKFLKVKSVYPHKITGEKMVCYVVPTLGMVGVFLFRKIWEKKPSVHSFWLNILLLGGAVFGVVDHLWNGELFLFGENTFMDISLGITITLAMIFIWAVMVLMDKLKVEEPKKSIQ
jgi:hypothetical protein